MRVRLDDTNITLFLYDGYDWNRTRKSIEEEAKNVRRRLAKIKQLLAAGQVGDPSLENTSTLLFNSIHIGLDEDIDTQDQDVLMAAIEKELEEDLETATQSSWQTLPPTSSHTHSSKSKSTRVEGKRLRRSRHPRMEFKLSSIHLEYDQYSPDQPFISRLFAVVKDLEILDHIKQSTWKKFLTDLYADSRGNVRETGSNMVQIELIGVRPVKGHPSEEARLRVSGAIASQTHIIDVA
jgi:autophagy-related protein 2